MPLRDHFQTNSTLLNCRSFYAMWVPIIAFRFNTMLPEELVARPRISELPEPDEYEANIYTQDEFRLLASIEFVSPSNKDRPENRQSFVNKCEALLKRDVCVTIVDPVTDRDGNLYGELLDELDAPRTAISRSGIYAVTCRGRRNGPRWRLESWEHELAVGAVLPTLPIWVSPELMFPLELEATYEETCRSLRIR